MAYREYATQVAVPPHRLQLFSSIQADGERLCESGRHDHDRFRREASWRRSF
jgi:hypothetical protein